MRNGKSESVKCAVRIHAIILSIAEVTKDVLNNVTTVILKWGIVVHLWGMSVAVIVLAGPVYFGNYVKELFSINLFGVWLLVDILLILIDWYV